MRIDIEMFAAGDAAEGAPLVSSPLAGMLSGFVAEIHRHPRAGKTENSPTHDLRFTAAGVCVNDFALWKKSSDRGDYLNGQLYKGGNWWASVNYLDTPTPTGAEAKLTIRYAEPKKDTGAGAGAEDGTGGRF